MAEFSPAGIIGAFVVKPTATQVADLQRYDKALSKVGHGRLHQFPASFMVLDLYVVATANNDTKASVKLAAPWPLTILAADVGAESVASAAGTVDILVDDVSILDAPEDVKTGVGVGQRVSPEDTKQDVDFGSTIHITQTASTAANMVGGQAHLYAQRR